MTSTRPLARLPGQRRAVPGHLPGHRLLDHLRPRRARWRAPPL